MDPRARTGNRAVTRYRTIVADPPWRYDTFLPSYTPATDTEHPRGPLPYPSLEVDEIASLPVSKMTEDDARLFLWTTNRYLPDSFAVAEAWGFRYQQTITWHKTGRVPPFGGWVAPLHSEFLLVCATGSPEKMGRWPSSVIAAPRGSHSRKPDVFLDLIEESSAAPRLEMFARRQRLGWDTWGNEALNHVEIA